MKVNIDAEKLLPLLKSFYELLGMKITIYDNKLKELLTYPSCDSAFCTMVNQCEELQAKCNSYIVRLCRQCIVAKKSSIFKCHANFAGIVAPLSERGIIIGHVFCGQAAGQEDTIAHLESVLLIVDSLVSHIVLNRLIYVSGKALELSLVEYIDNNLTEDLSVTALCGKFAISKSELYQRTGNAMPGGISQYIQRRRVEIARESILRNPDKPLWKISDEVGFGNYEYFLRVFKARTGVSAAALKRESQALRMCEQ